VVEARRVKDTAGSRRWPPSLGTDEWTHAAG